MNLVLIVNYLYKLYVLSYMNTKYKTNITTYACRIVKVVDEHTYTVQVYVNV